MAAAAFAQFHQQRFPGAWFRAGAEKLSITFARGGQYLECCIAFPDHLLVHEDESRHHTPHFRYYGRFFAVPFHPPGYSDIHDVVYQAAIMSQQDVNNYLDSIPWNMLVCSRPDAATTSAGWLFQNLVGLNLMTIYWAISGMISVLISILHFLKRWAITLRVIWVMRLYCVCYLCRLCYLAWLRIIADDNTPPPLANVTDENESGEEGSSEFDTTDPEYSDQSPSDEGELRFE